MRILVTGGAGYIGSVSVERLLEAGHGVAVLDDLSTGHRRAVPEDADLTVGSFGDRDTVRALIERLDIDAILHCAARSIVPESVADPATYYQDNVSGGIDLLEAARTTGVSRVVFSSTAAVYGNPPAMPIDESAALQPINPYGETKAAFEGALRWYAAAYGLRCVSLRYFNVAGASKRNGEVHRPETHLIPNVLRAAESDEPLMVFGSDYPTADGTCIRDYIHVEDLADAHLAALDATAPADPRTAGDDRANTPSAARALAINLGSESGFSVREVIRAAERVVGNAIPHTFGPRRTGDPPALVAANGRAHDLLGWKPRRGSLDEMVGSAWTWRRSHPGGYQDD